MAPSMSRQSQIVPYTTSFVCIVRWPAHIKFTRTRYDHAAMFGANATTHLNHTRHHHPPPRDDHSLGAKLWFEPLLSTVTPTLIIAPISKWVIFLFILVYIIGISRYFTYLNMEWGIFLLSMLIPICDLPLCLLVRYYVFDWGDKFTWPYFVLPDTYTSRLWYSIALD